MSLEKRVDKKTLLLYAAEICLALCLIYALYYLASSLGLQYSVLSNRSLVKETVTGNILSGPLDALVWGAAVFVVLAWLGYYLWLNKVRGCNRSFSSVVSLAFLLGLGVWVSLVILGLVGLWSLVLVSLLILGLSFVFAPFFFGVNRLSLFLRVLFGGVLFAFFIELMSFVLYNVPVALGLEAGGLGLHWSGVALAFTSLSRPFLPFVYLLFVLFGVGAFVFRVLPGKWSWLLTRLRAGGVFARLSGVVGFADGVLGVVRVRWVVLAVVVSSFVSCLFVWFTVLPWNNPTGMLVSVDSPVYYEWIIQMRSVDVNSALSLAFSNDRALFLVLCYVLSSFIPTVDVIQSVAALLIVLLGLVSLFVLRLFNKDRLVWVFGVLLVPFSFQSLGLIYSGYFANMLALILIFVYVILFFRVLDCWSSLGFFALLGVSVLVLFSHSWSWFIFALTLCAFLFLQWRLASHDRVLWSRFKIQGLLVGATVGVGLLSDFMRTLLSPVSSTASVASTVQSSLGLPNLGYVFSGLDQAVNITLGGVLASGLLVFLSFAGLFVLFRVKSEVSNFFVAWICVACVPILFAASDLVFIRSLFMLPWIVLSSLGLFGVVLFFSCGVRFIFKGWRLWVMGVLLVFVFLVLLDGSLGYLFNIIIW